MAKKRGRPSNQKPPSSSSTPKNRVSSINVNDSIPLDLNLLDDRSLSLESLDALDSKQTECLLGKLDVIRQRIKGKQIVNHDEEIVNETKFGDAHENQNETEIPKETEKPKKTDHSSPKQPNVWDNFYISKLRNAGGKLEFCKAEIKEGTAIGIIDKDDIHDEIKY
ncbi:hypothetical protein RIF29_20568 [Crotalaria pallida]|uniref:Uncharacterized protein n=1 Tax=Crotalaria pallida TaxID=3830 RepID=A0AAN9F9X6_CROPI